MTLNFLAIFIEGGLVTDYTNRVVLIVYFVVIGEICGLFLSYIYQCRSTLHKAPIKKDVIKE